MIIGVPKEIKTKECRVAMIPAGVKTLAGHGHKVLIQRSAGEESGISDKHYLQAGAEIKESAEDIFDEAEMIVKVKETLPEEYDLLHEDQVLFTYLHLAPVLELTEALLRQKVIAIAYETIQLEDGSLPLLIPMSEIAGKLSVQVGAHYLQKENGGSGVLLGGVPGTEAGRVAIIGAGTVGANAAKVALGMGANVTILDIDLNKLRHLKDISPNLTALVSNSSNIEAAVAGADLLVGCVLIPGATAPRLVTKEMISKMRRGSVIVDVAVDQGGCFETTVPTSLDNPTFVVDGVIHYCVPNMPSVVARTSTFALTSTTFPYVLKLANSGYQKALTSDVSLCKGLNVYKGNVTNKAVADSLCLEYAPFEALL
ncbi:MAG: alanine dehydrogenase [Dehalococcoidia bacterium]